MLKEAEGPGGSGDSASYYLGEGEARDNETESRKEVSRT